MTINASVELYHPEEMEAFAVYLTSAAAARREREKNEPKDFLSGINHHLISGWENTRQADADTAAVEPEEKPKRTRGPNKPKATTTVADLPKDVVAEAEAAGVHVEDESRIEKSDEPGAEVEKEAEPVEKQAKVEAEPAKLTENDVRNLIIDFLNEQQAANPDDADIRTKTLKPLLEALDAPKISAISEARYGDVPGLIEAARKGGAK